MTMASSGVPADPEQKEAYYLRLHLLIVKEGTAILKARFDHTIPPNNLHTKLQERKVLDTINYGKNNNIISKSQYDLLYPTVGPPGSENFDISLLVYLLRNICGMKRKSNWWKVNDNSKISDAVIDEEADIVRIRNMRNQMNHKYVASIEQTDFEAMWDLAEQAMVRLALKSNILDQKMKIDNLKAKQLDLVTEEMRSIRGNTEIFLQDFHDDAHYVKTDAYEKAKTLLQDKQIVVLTGHPGEGKTTMAARLALEMSLPRNCLKMAKPSDWRLIDPKLKLFDTIIIDDIFGTSVLKQELVGDWRSYLPEIERATKAKEIRVIITSRHYIFEESREELGSQPMFKGINETILLLSSSDLTHTEKTDILRMQATKNEKQIPEDILDECIEASKGPTEEISDFLFGFPECASMFVRSEDMLETGAQFFRKPASFFKKYLEDLYKGKEKDKFLALVAVWAQESKRISQSELTMVNTVSEHVKRIAEVFGLKLDGNFLETIRQSLDSHIGGYLVFTDATGDYTFSHNIIGDMVGLVVGKKKPEHILEICPRDFLMEYITVDDAVVDEFKIVVKERQFPYLAKKCTNMLLRNNCNRVAENPSLDEFQTLQRRGQRSNDIQIFSTIDFGVIKHKAFNSEKFVKTFINYITEKRLVEDVFNVTVMIMKGYFLDYGISMERLNMCLLGYAWYSGAAVLAKEVIISKILRRENFDSSVSLLLATHSKQRVSVEFLLEYGAKVTGDVIYIATHNNVDLLKILLQQPGTNVNDRGNAVNGNYPLIVAARKGFTEAVRCMIEFHADTGVQNTVGMTALHKAILYKHSEILTSLIEAGAPLDIKGGSFKRTPMHLAVDLGNEGLVQYLLDKGASLRIRDHRGHYPIHIAAIRGSIPILRKLFNADKTQETLRISSYGTKSVIRGMSLFHIAVWKKSHDLLDALIALKANPNVQDFYGQTPLFFAIMKKQEGSARKLIAYENCDKRKPQKQGYTPLHAAIHENQKDLAISLAEYSDVNAQDKYGKTPLHVACEKANIEVISMLLRQYGADPRIVTKRGDTVYHILRRCKKKLPENGVENSKQAEQMIAEFDPEFAQQLPKLLNKSGIVIRARPTNRLNTNARIDFSGVLGRNDMHEAFLDDNEVEDLFDDGDYPHDMNDDSDDGGFDENDDWY